MKNIKLQNKKGFALLFSVLISSLLLTIGLSIFSIALKELAISTAARQSVHAFFAADSGREFVLYRDIKLGDIVSNVAVLDSGPVIATSTDYVVSGGVGNQANYITTITKKWNNPTTKVKIDTEIKSRGYDTKSDDRVERAIEQSY